MTLIPIKCTSCGAAIDITSQHAQEFCKCDHCGTGFVIKRPSARSLNLVSFDSLAKSLKSNSDFLAAETRLRYIDNDIHEWNQKISSVELELHNVQARKDATLEPLIERIKILNKVRVATVLGTILSVVIALTIGGLGILFGMLACAVCVFIYRRIGNMIKRTDETAKKKTRIWDGEMSEAAQPITALTFERNDFQLEKELCETQVKNFRFNSSNL